MTKENCYSTTQFIRQEFKALVNDINKKRKQNDREELKVNCKPDSWNPAQMRLADLEEM